MPMPKKLRCWVPHCPNAIRRTRSPNCHFHAFPVKSIERCRRWLQAVGYEDLVYLPMHSLKMRYVCSEHFEEADYGKYVSPYTSSPGLLFTAIPSKFPSGTIPLSDQLFVDWPPQLASDRNHGTNIIITETNVEEMKNETQEPEETQTVIYDGGIVISTSPTESFPQPAVPQTVPFINKPADTILTLAASAGICQPENEEVVRITPLTSYVQLNDPQEEALPPLPQDLLMRHLSENSGGGLIDGDMLLGFVVQRHSKIEVVPVGPGHSAVVASCLEELLTPTSTQLYDTNGTGNIR